MHVQRVCDLSVVVAVFKVTQIVYQAYVLKAEQICESYIKNWVLVREENSQSHRKTSWRREGSNPCLYIKGKLASKLAHLGNPWEGKIVNALTSLPALPQPALLLLKSVLNNITFLLKLIGSYLLLILWQGFYCRVRHEFSFS